MACGVLASEGGGLVDAAVGFAAPGEMRGARQWRGFPAQAAGEAFGKAADEADDDADSPGENPYFEWRLHGA